MPEETKQLSPEHALLKIRARLDNEDGKIILGKDGLPIHWMIKESDGGLQFLDSAYLMLEFNYGAINFLLHAREGSRIMTPEELQPLFQRMLDWLALNLPRTKTWGVEFKLGCPIIPCNRELINGDE